MTLTFRSSSPQRFTITGVDPDGRTRTATATRADGDFNWQMRLQHPSGRFWEATFRGPNVLDALGEMIVSKDIEFKQDKMRGDRLPAERYNPNRNVDNNAVAPITMSGRDNRR